MHVEKNNEPPLSDRQLRAIGLVAVQWAALEAKIDADLKIMSRRPDINRHDIRLDISLKRRLDIWRDFITKIQYKSEIFHKEIFIINSISRMKIKRDHIIHGEYFKMPNDQDRLRVTLTRHKKTLTISGRYLSAEKIEKTAHDIGLILHDLTNHHRKFLSEDI